MTSQTLGGAGSYLSALQTTVPTPYSLSAKRRKYIRHAVLGSGAIAAIAIYGWTQTAASKAPSQTCDSATTASSTSNQAQCPQPMAIAGTIPERSINAEWGLRQAERLPDDMEAMYGKRIEQAQAAAKSEQMTKAVADVAVIPKNSRHYALAQRLQTDWSQELLRRANQRYQQADVKAAVAILDAVPPSSQIHQNAVELQTKWQQQSVQWQRAIAAKNAKDWQGTIDAIKALENTPLYNSLAVQELLQQAIIKRYEPDQSLLQIAMADLPAAEPAIVSAEAIPVSGQKPASVNREMNTGSRP